MVAAFDGGAIPRIRAPSIRALLEAGALQLSLFDERDRTGVPRRAPGGVPQSALAAERARKRQALLAAIEADLRKVAAKVNRRPKPLRGAD